MTREELRTLIHEVLAEAMQDLHAETASRSATEELTVTEGMLTEKQVNAAAANKIETVHVTRSVLITPLARDAARRRGIAIRRID